jgi:hypothetical protein
MESEVPPVVPIRLKVEINTREHFSVFGTALQALSIKSPWFEGRADTWNRLGRQEADDVGREFDPAGNRHKLIDRFVVP